MSTQLRDGLLQCGFFRRVLVDPLPFLGQRVLHRGGVPVGQQMPRQIHDLLELLRPQHVLRCDRGCGQPPLRAIGPSLGVPPALHIEPLDFQILVGNLFAVLICQLLVMGVRLLLGFLLLPCGVPGLRLALFLGLDTFPLGKRRLPCIEVYDPGIGFLDHWLNGHSCLGHIRSGLVGSCLRVGFWRCGFGWRWLGNHVPVNGGSKFVPRGIRET